MYEIFRIDREIETEVDEWSSGPGGRKWGKLLLMGVGFLLVVKNITLKMDYGYGGIDQLI